MKKKLLVTLFFLCPISCSDPMKEFYDQMKHYGYIPYTTPMSVAGTGTLIGGSPKGMSIIANPDTCFPNVNGGDTPIRFRDDTVLPSTQMHFFIDSKTQASFLKALSAGAPSVTVGIHISHVSTMELNFQGVHIEYFDSVKLVNFYRNYISQECKDYLDRVGFIIQAIVADQMQFTLYKSDGGQIQLSVDNINQYLNFSENTQWEIDSKASLIIKTPKYVGYQLGELRSQDQGIGLRRSRQVILNNWVWENIGIFKDN